MKLSQLIREVEAQPAEPAAVPDVYTGIYLSRRGDVYAYLAVARSRIAVADLVRYAIKWLWLSRITSPLEVDVLPLGEADIVVLSSAEECEECGYIYAYYRGLRCVARYPHSDTAGCFHPARGTFALQMPEVYIPLASAAPKWGGAFSDMPIAEDEVIRLTTTVTDDDILF